MCKATKSICPLIGKNTDSATHAFSARNRSGDLCRPLVLQGWSYFILADQSNTGVAMDVVKQITKAQGSYEALQVLELKMFNTSLTVLILKNMRADVGKGPHTITGMLGNG